MRRLVPNRVPISGRCLRLTLWRLKVVQSYERKRVRAVERRAVDRMLS